MTDLAPGALNGQGRYVILYRNKMPEGEGANNNEWFLWNENSMYTAEEALRVYNDLIADSDENASEFALGKVTPTIEIYPGALA